MSVPTTTPSLTLEDFFATTLSAGISASDTVIPVNAAPTSSEGFLVLDQDNNGREVIYYTSKDASTVTCPDVSTGRGQGGTTAASHSAGATVKMNLVSQHLKALQAAQSWSSDVRSGWRPGSGAWTYVSATTITVPTADAASICKGTRLRLTQTTIKYLVVVGVSGNTLTVTGGTDYTLANAAITAPSFSNDANPIGYPQWFAYAPTLTGFGTAPTQVVARFKVDGSACTLAVTTNNGTSNATTFTIPLPITAATVANMFWKNPCYTIDAGTAGTGAESISVQSAATNATITHNDNNSGWTASGSKGMIGQVIYEI